MYMYFVNNNQTMFIHSIIGWKPQSILYPVRKVLYILQPLSETNGYIIQRTLFPCYYWIVENDMKRNVRDIISCLAIDNVTYY